MIRTALAIFLCAGLTVRATAGELSARLRLVARGPLPARALGRDRVLVTARVTGGADTLAGLGFSAQPLSRDVAALEVDRASLEWLASRQDLAVRLEERRVMHPLLDRATAAVGAPAAREATGITGRGVLVGVVDTGIDFRHRDMRHADGSTRIVGLLDLAHPGDDRHLDLGNFGGLVWDRTEIDAQLAAEAGGPAPAAPVIEVDDDGHGTHVVSIATSNGLATANGLPAGRYVGVAPEADLVVAQTRDENGGFSDVSILTACRFLLAEADALGRPLVVNMSLGGPGGPHDGNTNSDLALEQLFPRDVPGRALVIAAGNDGGEDLHAGGWALDGEVSLPLLLSTSASLAALEVWYRGDVELAIETPDGERTAWVAPGDGADRTWGPTRVIVDNASRGALPGGQRDAAIVLTDPSGKTGPSKGTFRVHVRGRSIRWDAWVVQSTARWTGGIDVTDHLDTPGTSRSAITVGALVSRVDWPKPDGGTFVAPGRDPSFTGGPATFSSMGPTADGRFSPDVSAPGEFIVAAMSADAPPSSPTSSFHVSDPSLPEDALVADDGLHGALRGTSQATPMVTGTIALLLQADPTLSGETLREVLRTTAAPVEGTSGWSPRVGFGRIDVGAALALVRGTRGGPVSATASRVGVSRDLLPPDSEETTMVTATPRDATGRALGPGHAVTIEVVGDGVAGVGLGGVRDVGAGRYERSFVAHAPRGSAAKAVTTVDGVVLEVQPEVFFARSRVEIGGRYVAGGGCSTTGGPASSGWAALVALLLRGRRRPSPSRRRGSRPS